MKDGLDVGLNTGPIQSMPALLMFVLLVGLFMVGHEAGVRLRRALARRKGVSQPEDVVAGYLPAALGLMALLVGFTFGMSLDRYNTRRALVMDEANAIEVYYRRLDTLEAPLRAKLVPALARYLGAREAFSTAATPQSLAQANAVTQVAEAQLWSETVAVVNVSKAPQAGALLGAASDMFKVADTRRWALQARVPLTIVRAMLLYSLIASVFMGYGLPLGRRYFVPSTVQFILLSLAFVLVMDLDRPHSGVVQVSQGPIMQTAEAIRAAEAARAPPEQLRGP